MDLQNHHSINPLPTRKGQEVTAWIWHYSNIEIISRDDSKTYEKAITKGLLHAKIPSFNIPICFSTE